MKNVRPAARQQTSFILWKAIAMMLCLLPATMWAQPALNADNNIHFVNYNGSFQDFTVPVSAAFITLSIKGGDGGSARAFYDDGISISASCTSPGGKGATVTAQFAVGDGTNQIPPGSIIRFIIGNAGESGNNFTFSAGGGGGASGILYKAPGAPSFTPLTIAGGGGGAYQGIFIASCQDDSPGGGGNYGSNGDSGGGDLGIGSGGSGGNGGGANGAFAGGGGGGLFSDGDGVTCIGLSFSLGFVTNVAGEGHRAEETGSAPGQGEGCSSFSSWKNGGFGYGSGGAGQDLGGGGGGYSGGGSGGTTGNGGGGGSYVNGIRLSESGSDGGTVDSPASGLASYQIVPRPSNDLCSNAIALTCGGTISGTTVNSSAIGIPPNCFGVVPAYGVWFTYSNPVSQFVTLSTNNANTNFDSRLAVYSSPGGCTAFLCVASNDDPGGPFATVNFLAQAGVIYYIYLDGFNNATGEYGLSTSCCNLPQAICKNATVQLDANGNGTLTVAQVNNGSTAACGLASLSVGKTSFNCSNVGPNTVTLTVTDINNNTSTCNATVTVVDIIPPVVTCSPQTLTFNGESSFTLDPDDLVDADDNCGVQSITINPPVISCALLGQTVSYTATVTDVNGNVVTCTNQITVTGLPCGWSQNPNGINCANGSSAAYNTSTGVFSLTSINCYYANPFQSDALAFVQRTLCGDGSITTQVTGISGSAHGWAGVVMRENNNAGAKKAQLITNLQSRISRREARATTNGQAYPQQFPSQDRYWLRIVRAGSQFSMYTSPNGQNWYLVGSQTISMADCIEIGLVATNYQQTSTVLATFANVSVTGGTTPLAAPDAPATVNTAAPDFEVYPNPTTGEVTVDLKAYANQVVRLEVYDVQGKVLKSVEIDAVETATERLDLSAYQNGIYLIRVQSDGLPDATKRVVVQGNIRP